MYGASSYPDFVDYRNQADAFDDIAAYTSTTLNTTSDTEPAPLRGVLVTGNYFNVLGVNAQLGRTLQASDEEAANSNVIVISDGLWRRRYNSSSTLWAKR